MSSEFSLLYPAQPAAPATIAPFAALVHQGRARRLWMGQSLALETHQTFAFLAGALGFIGANSIEVGPMPNMAITMLGVVWIGIMGSFAALILRWSTFGAGTPWGTDTLVLIAIGVVANDIGAYFVGSAFGPSSAPRTIDIVMISAITMHAITESFATA